MDQRDDRFACAAAVVFGDRFFRLEHDHLGSFGANGLDGFFGDLEDEVHASREDHRSGVVLEEIFGVGELNSGVVPGAGLSPIPFFRAARVEARVLKIRPPVTSIRPPGGRPAVRPRRAAARARGAVEQRWHRGGAGARELAGPLVKMVRPLLVDYNLAVVDCIAQPLAHQGLCTD
jgi:hypothetical protein